MNDTKTNIIKISGKNIDNFFQNLITNDINHLTSKNAIYTAFLTPQGKYLYDFFIIRDEKSLLIECNQNKTNSLINEIKKYDIRDEIKTSINTTYNTFVVLKKDLKKEVLEEINESKLLKKNNLIFF